MQFSTKRGAPEMRATPCIAVGVYAGRKLSAAANALDRVAQGALGEVLRRGDMEGKLGATLLLYRLPGVAAERVLLVGSGRPRRTCTNASTARRRVPRSRPRRKPEPAR